MEELRVLLEKYFIFKDNDKDTYYSIKDNYKNFKTFIKDKLGYELLIRGDFIKLEKLPGKAEGWMGIDEFDDIREYIFLMLLITFLEDKTKGEQFLLSHITDFISSNAVGEKVDWTNYRTRRSLIKVLKFALQYNIIVINDGKEEDFIRDNSVEVLYESTGLSRYMVRNFPVDIMKCKNYKDIEDFNVTFLEEEKGFIVRNRVYRRLLISPIVYNEGADDSDYIYIKKHRGIIEEDFRKYLNWDLHVHRNGALIVLGEGSRLKKMFPSNSALSDIVLHLNSKIIKLLNEGKIQRNVDDVIVLSEEEFKDIISELKCERAFGWSKEYRECSILKLMNDIIEFMKSFAMITQDENINVYPLIGKLVGDYPKDYVGGDRNGK
ncbi:hypothetical protein CLTEP_10590 [Clostridium tepidiprofundi DSM 19306]|uniref:TIGR02678 family protein n=1 Tax=Clostridium tepidiprofundi DSM 19306 TaxID=1121338 RepID=A0A151B5A8_9CLOT|nr:TIGR02678 family protein [Clostridium tepidiprofundi]KYH35066.1 hypothetical protein CLTEP_10590 [Clostridium tepidiprofundi DSM 19306]